MPPKLEQAHRSESRDSKTLMHIEVEGLFRAEGAVTPEELFLRLMEKRSAGGGYQIFRIKLEWICSIDNNPNLLGNSSNPLLLCGVFLMQKEFYDLFVSLDFLHQVLFLEIQIENICRNNYSSQNDGY